MKKLLLSALTFVLLGSGVKAQTTYTSSPSVTIPDNNTVTGISDIINIPAGSSIIDLNVAIDITHSWCSDVIVTLESPTGTIVTLIDKVGPNNCSGDNIIVTLDDAASNPVENECPPNGTFSPNNPLSAFNGENPVGNWEITVYDDTNNDVGIFNSWSLILAGPCLVNIPDANFKAYLTGNTAINTNGDTEIQCSEASAFTGTINCFNQSISDITGIEAFTALTELNCSNNSLSTLDLSQNIALTNIDCQANALTSLNVTNITNLSWLSCNSNPNLGSIDISSNTSLVNLNCIATGLTNLDISANLNLYALYCSFNSLQEIDLSLHTSITEFQCNNNLLTSLNLANGNNTSFAYFSSTNNPNLTCIQVDDVNYSTTNWTNIDAVASFSLACIIPLYVNLNATGNNDGSSWSNAFIDLQDALAIQTSGDEVWVAAGTYKPGSNTGLSFLINTGLKIYGGFNGTETSLSQRDWRINETILSGDLNGNDDANITYLNSTRDENSYHVVRVLGENTLIDGFTVKDGHANSATIDGKNGAGIFKKAHIQTLDITNCKIEKNVSYYNAGVYARFDVAGTQSVNITNTIFQNNVSKGGTALAIVENVGTCSVTVSNCLFTNNYAGNMTISTGLSTGFAGSAALFVTNNNSILDVNLINCTIADNTDSGTASANNTPTSPVVAKRNGGTLNFAAANNVFHNNNSQQSFGRMGGTLYPSPVTLKNNLRPDAGIWGGGTSTNELIGNPYFANVSNGDYSLTSVSSAINVGNNISASGIAEDLAGNSRVFGGTVDIGCYEFQSTPTPISLTIRYVDLNATGNNNGTSWTDAFTSIHTAITSSNAGNIDSLFVAAGTYTPHASDRSVSFEVLTGIKLFGGFNGTETSFSQRDWRTNETILSGDLNGNDNTSITYSNNTRTDNSHHVVNIIGENTLIDGFTISDGHSNGAGSDNGAGIIKDLSVKTVEVNNCKIEKNVSYYNAGMFINFNATGTHSAIITNSIFNHNVSKGGSAFSIGVENGTATATVANCLMTNNVAMDYSGSQGFCASAGQFMSNLTGSLTANLINCTIADNLDNGTNGSSADPSVFGIRRIAGTLNFNAHNNIFYNNNAPLSFGKLSNSTSCPTSINLSHNIRPDITSTTWCTGITNASNEYYNNPQLDANYFPTVSTSGVVNSGDNSFVVGIKDYNGNNRIVGGTVDLGAFESNMTTSIDLVTTKDIINIYPNPTSFQLTIDIDEKIETVLVLDITGKTVQSFIPINKTIDVSNLIEGIYFLQVQTKKGISNSKFIKQ